MTVNAFWLLLGALGVYAIFYRYYSGFLARKVVALDDARPTPAHTRRDGQNFHPTNRWVLWGHHFAAISGAGPLIGPVLAAQFGWLPGLLWLVFGVCLAGAVQDFVILGASVRRGGRSLAEIARDEISPASGVIAMIAILFIVVVALAVLGFIVVKALAESAWGTFAIAASIPIALLMGLYMYRIRPGRVGEASALGVSLLMACVVLGGLFAPGHPWAGMAHVFTLSETSLTVAIAVYGFLASVLPVWMLLCPRDYLSSYMKVGTIALIVLTVFIVRPEMKAPAVSVFASGGGPLVPGALFPFVFITIACGAISGFHALVSSGTTSKMLDKESHARAIGYGAMLMESLVGVTALVAASSLFPVDYFRINLSPQAFQALAAKMSLDGGRLSELAVLVGEPRLAGRTGGGVSLAVGIAQIFGDLPGAKSFMSYFYHFVIMFEALFVLTTIDTGTRIGRFLLQELLGRAVPRMARPDWLPGSVFATALIVGGWSFFIFTGSIQSLWPMFGVANQLLAVVALTVATSVLVNEGRARYAWVTIAPLAFLGTTTLAGGALSIRDIFLPMTKAIGPAEVFKGWLNSGLTAVMMVSVLLVLADAIPRWRRYWRTGRAETRSVLAAFSRAA
ncbi:MAG: carbon starvation protein A [Acidobacteriota bacterium]|nr:carbon starvation protein A [Acidobacteriota bacterium]